MNGKAGAWIVAIAAVAIVALGLVLSTFAAFARGIDEAPNPPTGQQTAEQTELYNARRESWDDRTRWYNQMDGWGDAMLAAALPLGITAFALAWVGRNDR